MNISSKKIKHFMVIMIGVIALAASLPARSTLSCYSTFCNIKEEDAFLIPLKTKKIDIRNISYFDVKSKFVHTKGGNHWTYYIVAHYNTGEATKFFSNGTQDSDKANQTCENLNNYIKSKKDTKYSIVF